MNANLAEYWADRAHAELDKADDARIAGNTNLQERHFRRASRCFQAEHEVVRGAAVAPALRLVK